MGAIPSSAHIRDPADPVPAPDDRPGSIRQPLTGAVEDMLFGPLEGLVVLVRTVLARPAWLAALSVLLICVPISRDLSASANISPGDLGFAALGAAVVPAVLNGARLPPSGLWLAMAAAVVGFGAATLTSMDLGTSVWGFVRYVEIFVVVPVALVLAVRDRRDLRLVCGALLTAAVIQGTIGTWQYLTRTGASFAGANVRAVGTFGAVDVMGLATVVGIGIVVALGLALVLRGGAQVALVALAALLVVPLLLSLSRGALVATIGATVAMLLTVAPRVTLRVAPFAAAAVFVLAGTLAADATAGVGPRVATIASSLTDPDRSVSDRYDLWATATGMWGDQPLTGVGLKMFPSYRDSYAPLHLSSGSDVEDPTSGYHRQALLSPHNLYLLVLSEQGLIGALGLGGFLFGLAMLTWRRTRREAGALGLPDGRHPDGRLISAVAVGALSWTLINSLFGDIGGQGTVLMSVSIGLALWWALHPIQHGADESGDDPHRIAVSSDSLMKKG
jgi:O-antigen ligase